MSDQHCPTLPSYHPSQVGCRIMSDQQWSLAPLHGVLACARPGYLLAGPLGRPGTLPSYHPCRVGLLPAGGAPRPPRYALTDPNPNVNPNPTCRLLSLLIMTATYRPPRLTKYDYYTC